MIKGPQSEFMIGNLSCCMNTLGTNNLTDKAAVIWVTGLPGEGSRERVRT